MTSKLSIQIWIPIIHINPEEFLFLIHTMTTTSIWISCDNALTGLGKPTTGWLTHHNKVMNVTCCWYSQSIFDMIINAIALAMEMHLVGGSPTEVSELSWANANHIKAVDWMTSSRAFLWNISVLRCNLSLLAWSWSNNGNKLTKMSCFVH